MTTAAAPSSARSALLALLSAGQHAQFVSAACAYLQADGSDSAIAFQAAGAAGTLGLPTLARDFLAMLPQAAQSDPAVVSLRARLSALPHDALHETDRARTFAHAVATLGRRLHGAEAVNSSPFSTSEQVSPQVLRAPSGLVVCSDARGRVEFLTPATRALTEFRQLRASQGARPIEALVAAGLAPGLIGALLELAPRQPDGFAPMVLIVEPNAQRAADILSLPGEDVQDERLRLFVGPGAAEAFAAFLRARPDAVLPSDVLSITSAPLAASLRATLDGLASAQQARAQALWPRVLSRYAGRSPEFWARRLAEPGPKRVLIPISRFSTFVRHSASDLAEAFRALGHQAEILTEPDDSTHLITTAYHEAIERLEPDLVVCINFSRHALANAFPPEVPFVCWAQDAMPHLFNERLGRAFSPLDFFVGHTWPELFSACGFPRSQTRPAPVVASDTKFTPSPAPAELLRKHACDVAYASHQSEPPEILEHRLRESIRSNPQALRVFEAVLPIIEAVASAPFDHHPGGELRTVLDAAFAERFPAAPPQVRVLMLTQFVFPLAERRARHIALIWAAELAEELGLRFHLYGRGWETHPRLASFARGPLDHGEALRASYQAAAVHLHVSLNSLVHQRVLECSLSGGLPLPLLHRDELTTLELWLLEQMRSRPVDVCRIEPRLDCWWTGDHVDLMRWTSLRQRLGLEGYPILAAHECYERSLASAPPPPRSTHADFLLGDLTDTTFRSKATLRDAIARAVERPEWRAETAASIRERVRAHLTHHVFARDMLEFVGGRLREGARP